MKEINTYLKQILVTLMIVVYNYPAVAQSEENGDSQDPTPTIKVAVFFTKSASDINYEANLNIFEYLEERENDIRQILQFEEIPINIEFTVKTFLEKYREPSLRGLSNPYTTFPHEEMDQVFDELANHQAISDFLNDPANDSDNDNTWDDVPDSEKYYFANKNNLDTRYLEYIKRSSPDVVLIIANAKGEPLIVDEAIWEIEDDVEDDIKYDQPLYAVVNAEYFARSPQALTFAFFSLFCRVNYSDSDLNTDDDLGIIRSLMSQEWTGVEGKTELTDLNEQALRYNIGKLKLSSESLPQVYAGETIDVTYGQSHVDNLSYILFTPNENGTPTLISTSTTASEYGDDVGQNVPLASSYINYASGIHSINSESTDAIPSPSSGSEPDDQSLVVSLPIDFDDDISSDTFFDYVEDDFGAESTFETDVGNSSTNGIRIVKREAEENQWAVTSISHVSGLNFTGGNKKLKMDVKSPDTDTDVMLILEDDEGNIVTKEYTTDDLVVNDWKELVFDFDDDTDKTGEIISGIDYHRISIQFNSCVVKEEDKTYFVDNIEIEKLDLAIKGSVNNPTPIISSTEDAEILVTVTVENKESVAVGNVKVKVNLPNDDDAIRYVYSRPAYNSDETTYNPLDGVWSIDNLPSQNPNGDEDTKKLQFYVKVKYVADDFNDRGILEENSYDIGLKIEEPSTDKYAQDNSYNIEVIPQLKGVDLEVSIAEDENFSCGQTTNAILVTFKNNDANKAVEDVIGVLNFGDNWTFLDLSYTDLIKPPSSVGSFTQNGRSLIFTINEIENSSPVEWQLCFYPDKDDDDDRESNKFVLIADKKEEERSSAGTIDEGKINNDPITENNNRTLRRKTNELADLAITEFNFVDDCLSPGSKGKIRIKVENKSEDVIATNAVLFHFLSPEHIRVTGSTPSNVFTPATIKTGADGADYVEPGEIDLCSTLGECDILPQEIVEVTLDVELLYVYNTPKDGINALVISDNDEDYENNSKRDLSHKSPNLSFTSILESPDVPCEVTGTPTTNSHSWTFTVKNTGNCTAKNVKFKLPVKPPNSVTTINNSPIPGSEYVVGDIEKDALKTITLKFEFTKCPDPLIKYSYSFDADNHEKRSGNIQFRNIEVSNRAAQFEPSVGQVTQQINTTTNLTLYPNPFTNTFKVVYDRAENAGSVVLARVYDLSGRVALEEQFSVGDAASVELEIDGGKLSIGNYIIELDDGSGVTKRGKLIKQQ